MQRRPTRKPTLSDGVGRPANDVLRVCRPREAVVEVLKNVNSRMTHQSMLGLHVRLEGAPEHEGELMYFRTAAGHAREELRVPHASTNRDQRLSERARAPISRTPACFPSAAHE